MERACVRKHTLLIARLTTVASLCNTATWVLVPCASDSKRSDIFVGLIYVADEYSEISFVTLSVDYFTY